MSLCSSSALALLCIVLAIGNQAECSSYTHSPHKRLDINAARRQQVVDAADFAFRGYQQYAWGTDELRPVTNTSRQWLHLGATIVSGLDTMYMMNLTDHVRASLKWIEEEFSFEQNDFAVPTFETNIRILGGFLGAYTVMREPILLKRAIEVGDALLPAFRCGPLPNPQINLATGKCTPDMTNLASMGTFSLEFEYLSHLSGNKVYALAARNARSAIWKAYSPLHDFGLEPQGWDPESATPIDTVLSMGGGSDSYYE